MQQPGRRPIILPLLSLAAAWHLLGGTAFMPAPRAGAGAAAVSGRQGGALRGNAWQREGSRTRHRAFPTEGSTDPVDQMLDEAAFPPEQLWTLSPDGMVLSERYPGSRDFVSVFWAIVQPAAAAGFLIVGISAYFQSNIVDWNPITKQLLPFLRITSAIQWFPQGIFMSFYGFFGLVLFGPLQWWLVSSNLGNGIAEFNKNTQRFTIIRDGELLRDISFDEIQQVKLEWTNLFAAGAREIYLITKDNQEIHFMDTLDELPKRVLERRASILADFLGKELDVDDS